MPVATHISTLILCTCHSTLVRARPSVLGPNFYLPPCLCSTVPCALIQSPILYSKPSLPHSLRSSASPTSPRKSVPAKVTDSQLSELQLPTHYSAFIDYPSFRFLQHLRAMPDNLGLKDCLLPIVPSFFFVHYSVTPSFVKSF